MDGCVRSCFWLVFSGRLQWTRLVGMMVHSRASEVNAPYGPVAGRGPTDEIGGQMGVTSGRRPLGSVS